MQAVFKFLIKDKVIPVQPFDKLMNISNNIRNELIFSSEHSYQIESKVRQEIIEEFIKYIIFDETPEITINNINEYETLSKEFSIFEETINKKKHEYGEYLINFNGLSSEDEGMRNIYLERITTELDEYLTRFGEEMMQISIQTLYNIFNHSKRKLNNHNLAYEHIISYYNKTQDSNIFILLDLLDGSKLSRNNIEESYSLSTLRNNHIPKIDFSTINELFSTQRKQEQLLEEQRLKYDELLITMNKQQQKQEEDEVNYKKTIEILENKIEQLINTQQQKQTKILEEQKIKYSELLTTMNKQQEQQEIKYKQTIKALENKIELMNSQQRKQSELLEKQGQNEITYKKSIEKLEKHIKNIEQDKGNLKNQILDQNSKITKLEEELLKTISKDKQNNCQPFVAKLDKSSPGILQRLKNNEKSPFDHLYIPSQSSGDIYNIIDPNTNSFITITNIGKFIEIELQDSIVINGIKLFSASNNFLKSFDIEIDNENVVSINEAKELNGQNREMIININPIQCQKIRITNRGQNWDKKNNEIHLKRIELLSNEKEYSRGVFSTFIYKSKNHDPHKCPLLISASDFDFNSFNLINNPKNICTLNIVNSWFQIEFPKGKAIISGFRLKRCNISKLKKYKIICTDDVFKSLEEWTTLIEIDEKSESEHEMLDIYEFSQPSPPIKFVLLIQTGKSWNNDLFLQFTHFDLFGSYS